MTEEQSKKVSFIIMILSTLIIFGIWVLLFIPSWHLMLWVKILIGMIVDIVSIGALLLGTFGAIGNVQ